MVKFKLTTRKGTSRIDLGSVLDIRAAEPLRDVLRRAISKGGPLALDAGSVDRMSTPCIQILIAAAAAVKEAETTFTIVGPSDTFIESFNELGLFPVLKQWNIEG
ncbi:MAG: STAS domain-containing protein [Planctomycetota bacterium]|jgi:anti-anti-sigma factor